MEIAVQQTSISPKDKLKQTISIRKALEAKLKQNPDRLATVVVADDSLNEPFNARLYFLEPKSKHVADSDSNSILSQNEHELAWVPTRCSQEQIDSITSTFAPLTKTCIMLRALQLAYRQKTMIILEGGTSLGKSYAVNFITKLMYGANAKAETFDCNGQSDTSELLGKYAPNYSDPGAIAVEKFRQSTEYQSWLQEKIDKNILSAQSEEKRVLGEIAAHLGVTLNDKSFTLVFGAIPKAAMASMNDYGDVELDPNNPGPGVPLHIQEAGLMKTTIAKALMALRGSNKQLVDSFQLWQDAGRRIPLGPNFMIFFSTNTLDYDDREPLDPALARACTWVRMGELEDTDIKEAGDYFFRYQLGNKPSLENVILDITENEKLCQVLRDVVVAFHQQFAPLVAKKQAGGDRQITPCTFDNIAEVSRLLLDNQVINSSGDLDITATLKRAIEISYIANLKSESDRNSQRVFLNELIEDEKSVVKLKNYFGDGKDITPKEAITILVRQMMEEETLAVTLDPSLAIELEERRKQNELVTQVKAVFWKTTSESREELIVAINKCYQDIKTDFIGFIQDSNFRDVSNLEEQEFNNIKNQYIKTLSGSN